MATPFPFSVGAVLTASQMNSIGEAGIAYTPGVTAIVGTLTSATATAKYVRVNKLMYLYFTINVTNAGTASVGFYLSLPSGITTPVVAGTPLGRNRENNISGAIEDNLVASSTLISVFAFPAAGRKYDGYAILETA